MTAVAGKFKAELKTASEEPSKLRISKTSTPADIAAKIEKMADKEELKEAAKKDDDDDDDDDDDKKSKSKKD